MFDLFGKAKKIIDNLYPRAEKLVHDGDVDSMVKTRLNQLSQSYSYTMLNENRDPIDYSKTTTHMAYVYRSLACHADWIYKALHNVDSEIFAALDEEIPRISCIGGGPGTEILGFMKFIHQNTINNERFGFYVLDNQKGWNNCRSELIKTIPKKPKVAQKFVEFDATNSGKWVKDWKFAESDIFTFSFSLSELWSFNGNNSVSEFLDELTDKARDGAIFICVDNGGENFVPLLTSEFERFENLNLIYSDDDQNMRVSFDEQCDSLKEAYQGAFGQWPKLKGNVCTRVWKKE